MGIMEIVMILLVTLLVVGPDKLPEYARKFGRYYREFKKIASGATSEMSKALGLDEDEDLKEFTDELKSMRDGMSSLRASLNEDADELKEAVASEAKQVKESIDEETGEIISELKAETQEISQDVGESFQELGDQFTQEASELKETLREDAEQLAENLSESGREIQEKLKQQVEEIQDAITAPVSEPEATSADMPAASAANDTNLSESPTIGTESASDPDAVVENPPEADNGQS